MRGGVVGVTSAESTVRSMTCVESLDLLPLAGEGRVMELRRGAEAEAGMGRGDGRDWTIGGGAGGLTARQGCEEEGVGK